jgi:hypothetical protein
MTYELVYRVGLGNAQSPFRVIAQPEGREVAWINRFLDQCMVRGLAWHTCSNHTDERVWNAAVRRQNSG